MYDVFHVRMNSTISFGFLDLNGIWIAKSFDLTFLNNYQEQAHKHMSRNPSGGKFATRMQEQMLNIYAYVGNRAEGFQRFSRFIPLAFAAYLAV